MTSSPIALPVHSSSGPVRAQLPIPDPCDLPGLPAAACKIGEEAVSGAASSVVDDLVDTLLDGFATGLQLAMAWWTSLPSPELVGAGGEPGSALSAIREYSGGLQVVLLTAGIMFAAARLAVAKRGGVAGEAQESFLMLARAVFASMAFAAVITAGTRAGDAFAEWVLFDASSGDVVGTVARLTTFDAQTQSGLGTGVLLLVALFGGISMLVQLVMLVVRQALLILVVAVIPMAAAASGTGPGEQSYKKLLSWSLAFVLWKPVGALVYAIAFTVIGTEDQADPHMILLGLILLVMSVIVLPALMRLVAPAVATLGAGGGAATVLAGGGAGVAMGATGDRSNGRKISEGDNGASGPPSGDTGGPSPGSGGGGGRAISGGSPAETGSMVGSGGSGGGESGGSAGGGGGAGGAAKSSSAKTAAGGGSGAAAGAAGPAGALVVGGQMLTAAAQQGASAVDAQVRDATEGGPDPDAFGPGEVRR